ncbi:MAG: hypothetical protein DRI52_12750 [Chloroflexi bacterium]|nr:MAG: hypothetical protein DRI52_12750 [Chloroflexota bacterium]
MELPKVGETVSTEQALELGRHFGLEYLVERILAHPETYREWTFDGCSGLPDEVMGFFTGCNWKDITYQCCLPHDLCYGYGEPGNSEERKRVDLAFHDNLVNKAGMKKWCASAFLAAVRVGGAEIFGFSFSWAFAHRKEDR